MAAAETERISASQASDAVVAELEREGASFARRGGRCVQSTAEEDDVDEADSWVLTEAWLMAHEDG